MGLRQGAGARQHPPCAVADPGRDRRARPRRPATARSFDAACAFLEAVRRAKSAAGATVGRHLARLRVAVSPRNAALLAPCRFDLASASRVEGEILEPREGLADDAFEVVAIELADLPPEA